MGAAASARRRLSIGECKYRESFDESAELADLEGKRDLVKGYHATHLYLFTKRPVSAGTAEKCVNCDDVAVVTLDDMYR